MTVQAYDQYGDAWNASDGANYAQTIVSDSAWIVSKSDGTNPYNIDSVNPNKVYYLTLDDDTTGCLKITFDTTELGSGWQDAWGSDFTIGYNYKVDTDGDNTDDYWPEGFTDVTVTNISDMDSDYSVSLSGLEGSYDLTRAYEKDDSDTYAWGFANPATEDFNGRLRRMHAAAAEGNVITVTPNAEISLTEEKGEVGSSVDKDSFEASIAKGSASNEPTCTVSVTGVEVTYTAFVDKDGSES